MKNKTINLIAILLLIGIAGCNTNKANNKEQLNNPFAPLKERNETLSKLGDWQNVKTKAAELFVRIEKDSLDLKSKLLLAQLYMKEARITGEHPYYYPAAITILNDVLKHDDKSFEANAFKASVLLSLHHFKEALEVGEKAKNINSNNGFIYGVLCDANVELGHYEEAVKMSDMMQSVRPGLESYSRASYLREIYGDNAGAIEAMKLAFQAGLPGSEEASWAGNILSHLYENTGNLKDAFEISQIVLLQRPSYPFGVDAMGRIEMAKGNFDNAIVWFDSAISIIPEVSFYEHKAAALTAKGDKDQAKKIYSNVIKMLSEDAQSGHYVDMEMANVYLELGDYNKALKYAKAEHVRRHENIDANATMAWVYYKMGNFSQAKKHMDKGLRMGTQNAKQFSKAAAIENAMDNLKAGQNYFEKSKKINPLALNKSS